MRRDVWFDSHGTGRIHACCWEPKGSPRAVVQLVHGIAEFVERYDDFANFLAEQGILVVAEDHMGHGQSINGSGIQGYFHGGWFAAVEDTCQLMKDTMAAHPGVPYVLFGHSMGSFMARTILCKYPDIGLTAAIICGTGWQPTFAMPLMIKLMDGICQKSGETLPNGKLDQMIFGGYNARIENRRTDKDWLSRDAAVVDAYIAHPLCGFTATSGLLRDMMTGICYIQQTKNLASMNKDLPVLFIAGGEDPVGSYGKGVHQAAAAFRKAGMADVTEKIYPLCRHEILNELNREEIFRDILKWIQQKL